MANNYFQFKQFTIHQDRCAMKVCTDACIFGASVAQRILSRQLAPGNILDIGAGTGLLSIMLAQKTAGKIDSVELDEPAFQQSRHNFTRTPWKDRLIAYNADALQFDNGKLYDCIISNPPFFEGDLRSESKEKNAAKHDTGLTLEQLVRIPGRLLSPQGFFAVLLPLHRVEYFIEIARSAGLYLDKQILIRHTDAHIFSRGILFFSHQKTVATCHDLAIKNAAGNYTPAFIELLKDYYLHL